MSFIHPHYLSRWYRLLNFFTSFLLLLAFIPFALITWPILILIIDKPVIFKQKRLGQNGEIFTLYKLRSMVKNAEALRGRYHKKYQKENQAPKPMFKISKDPRFIKKQFGPFNFNVGYFLSHSGIDELPQLINILKGEMNFIGPRPLPIKEATALAKKHPQWHQWRCQVKQVFFPIGPLIKIAIVHLIPGKI